MKKSITLFAILFVSLASFAQQGINYKAVIKDGSGNLLAGTFMNVQFTIHETTETGTIVYQEDHNYTTDANGLLIHNIGSEPSPSVGVFTDIDWGADLHFLQVTITYSGGTINFNATEFMAVPYALHAANVSGLEKINENGQTGWRLKNVDPANYGDIGLDAVDLSINKSFINGLMGATGEISTALGTQTTASGVGSTAMGIGSEASGVVSTAIGYTTIASGLASVAVGNSNIDITSAIFLVGNGDFNLGDPIRSNALEVYQNGTITAPSLTNALINSAGDKALVTKEYLETNGATGLEYRDETDDAIDNGGWRLKGPDPANYGPIGKDAIDFSLNRIYNGPSYGALGIASIAMLPYSTATGIRSIALGTSSIASGSYAIAIGKDAKAIGINSKSIGSGTKASGIYSIAMGLGTFSDSFNSLAIGRYNIGGGYAGDPNDLIAASNWVPTDPLFEIGNGSSPNNRNNALTVLKNGTITAPSFDLAEITDDKALITKEYADINYASDGDYLIAGGNVVTNNVGIGRDTPASLLEVGHGNTAPTSADRTDAFSIRNLSNSRSWQFFTSGSGNLLLYNDGLFRGFWNATSGAYVQASDRRVKKDIIPFENGTLNKVMQLNPVSYLMKDQTDTKRNLGLISQEVQEIFPNITHYVEESDLLTLSYTELIPILIKALQEQQDIVEAQNSKISSFESNMTALSNRLEKLEAKNQ